MRLGVVGMMPSDFRAINSEHLAAELAEGDGESRVYSVAVTGPTENAEEQPDYKAPPHPAMS